MSTEAQTTGEQELDYIGQEIRSRLDSADKYAKKYRDLSHAAGVLLIDAKAKIEHGRWRSWLMKHGIGMDRAQRCMQMVREPDKYEDRLQYQRDYRAEPAKAATLRYLGTDGLEKAATLLALQSKLSPHQQALVDAYMAGMLSDRPATDARADDAEWDAKVVDRATSLADRKTMKGLFAYAETLIG